jgi:type 1 glutamine amidotransferase
VRTALLLTGGPPGHPFAATAGLLADLLAFEAIRATIVDDPGEAFDRLAAKPVDLFVVNALRWRMIADRYAADRATWATTTPPRAASAVRAHLARGGGILAVHTACICFDDWPGWGEVLGGSWDWERSSHSPVGPADVVVRADRHPIVAELDDFEVVDEVYGFLHHPEPVTALAAAGHGGAMHPIVWTVDHGPGRVVVDTLGHDERSFAARVHREIVRRGARWAVGEDLA